MSNGINISYSSGINIILTNAIDKWTLPQGHAGHVGARVVTGFELKPLLFEWFNASKIFTKKKKKDGEDNLRGRERKEGEVLFVHDHNKNLSFAGSLKDNLAQADINAPKKVCEDPTSGPAATAFYSVTHYYSNWILRYELMR